MFVPLPNSFLLHQQHFDNLFFFCLFSLYLSFSSSPKYLSPPSLSSSPPSFLSLSLLARLFFFFSSPRCLSSSFPLVRLKGADKWMDRWIPRSAEGQKEWWSDEMKEWQCVTALSWAQLWAWEEAEEEEKIQNKKGRKGWRLRYWRRRRDFKEHSYCSTFSSNGNNPWHNDANKRQFLHIAVFLLPIDKHNTDSSFSHVSSFIRCFKHPLSFGLIRRLTAAKEATISEKTKQKHGTWTTDHLLSLVLLTAATPDSLSEWKCWRTNHQKCWSLMSNRGIQNLPFISSRLPIDDNCFVILSDLSDKWQQRSLRHALKCYIHHNVIGD